MRLLDLRLRGRPIISMRAEPTFGRTQKSWLGLTLPAEVATLPRLSYLYNKILHSRNISAECSSCMRDKNSLWTLVRSHSGWLCFSKRCASKPPPKHEIISLSNLDIFGEIVTCNGAECAHFSPDQTSGELWIESGMRAVKEDNTIWQDKEKEDEGDKRDISWQIHV